MADHAANHSANGEERSRLSGETDRSKLIPAGHRKYGTGIEKRGVTEWFGKKHGDAWTRLTDHTKVKAQRVEDLHDSKKFERGEVQWVGRKYDESWSRLTNDPRARLTLQEQE